jgi:hypothetical protein
MRITEFRKGWAVVGNDGHRLGIIKEVGRDYVLISRSMLGMHLYVPVSSIANVEHETIHLNITRDDAVQMGWDQPPRHDEIETAVSLEASAPSAVGVVAGDASVSAKAEPPAMVRWDRAITGPPLWRVSPVSTRPRCPRKGQMSPVRPDPHASLPYPCFAGVHGEVDPDEVGTPTGWLVERSRSESGPSQATSAPGSPS